jgi:hypothetical protein
LAFSSFRAITFVKNKHIIKGSESPRCHEEIGTGDAEGSTILRLVQNMLVFENGAVRSSKDIQDAFAKAEHAVAEHHYLRAAEAWSKKSIKDAGHELHAAAVSLEHGFAWAGKKLEAGVVKVLDDSRHIAGKLIEGADWAKDEIGEGIEYLGREIEKFGKVVAGL